MVKQILSSDPVIRKLLELTNFPIAQLETLLIYSQVSYMKYDEQAKLRSIGPVSKGAYVRTLKQARSNIRRILYRLILLNYIGLMDKEGLIGIVSIIDALNKIRERGDGIKIEAIEEIFRAADSIVNSLGDVTSLRKTF